MNGELRLEKPPLPTWVAAGIEYLQPDNISLQRAAAGIMATLMAFFLYFFASALSGNRLLGLLSALVLTTSFNVIMAGRVATWDIYCHSFMLGAIFSSIKNKERAERVGLILSGPGYSWVCLSWVKGLWHSTRYYFFLDLLYMDLSSFSQKGEKLAHRGHVAVIYSD